MLYFHTSNGDRHLAKFTDKLNREWQLTINVAAMRRAKAQDIDLSMPVAQIQPFTMDDVFLTDALFAIVKTEADAKGITLEQFEAGLDGKTLDVAREAMWEALCEYYPEHKARMLRAALDSIAKEMAEATTSLTSIGSGDSKGSLGET